MTDRATRPSPRPMASASNFSILFCARPAGGLGRRLALAALDEDGRRARALRRRPRRVSARRRVRQHRAMRRAAGDRRRRDGRDGALDAQGEVLLGLGAAAARRRAGREVWRLQRPEPRPAVALDCTNISGQPTYLPLACTTGALWVKGFTGFADLIETLLHQARGRGRPGKAAVDSEVLEKVANEADPFVLLCLSQGSCFLPSQQADE